jgi:hypothetical protein
VTANDEQRERLGDIVGRLTSGDYALEATPGWTVGAVLAHLAFWDRLVIERWTRAIADDTTIPVSLSEVLTDLINGASLAQWLAMPAHWPATKRSPPPRQSICTSKDSKRPASPRRTQPVLAGWSIGPCIAPSTST